MNSKNYRAGKMYEIFKNVIKIAAATVLFAAIHSVLASKASKEKAS